MKVDEYQEAAIRNEDERVLLVAPPGSGKTTVLIEKIVHLIENVRIVPERLLVLTFSRSASENIRERVRRRFITGPYFGTIHALAYRELVGRSRRRILTTMETLRIISPILRKYRLSHEEGLSALSLISLERLKTVDTGFSEAFLKELGKVYKEGKGERFMDFDDLMDEFLPYLDTEEGRRLSESFDHILVDEFQDLNDIQLKIIRKISDTGGGHIFCVGDEDQCIYTFRGATSGSMVDFDTHFPGGRKLYLRYNYRSARSVVNLANGIIFHNRMRNEKYIENFRQDMKGLYVHYPQDDATMVKEIRRIMDGTPEFDSVAVLYRTNREMDTLMEYLIANDIPFSLLDRRYNFFRRPLYQDILLYLKEDMTKDEFLKAVSISVRGLTRRGRGELKELEVISVYEIGKRISDLNDRMLLISFLKDLDALRRSRTATAIDRIFYLMGYYEYLKGKMDRREVDRGKDSDSYRDRDRSRGKGRGKNEGEAYLNDSMESLEELKRKLSSFRMVKDAMRYIRIYTEIMEERHSVMERVVLGTMHSVKGMEFSTVIIMNMCQGIVPHEKSAHDLEGERRLWYVAVTRAENELHIMVPRNIGGRAMEPSQFILELDHLRGYQVRG